MTNPIMEASDEFALGDGRRRHYQKPQPHPQFRRIGAMKKPGFTISTLYLLTTLGCATAFSADPASFFPPELIRPAPITMAELAKRKTEGVSVAEVSDYVYGNYKGDFPSPPHADRNPKKAFIISWKDFPFRFVFSHEGSYCPWFELPSGAAMAYQFFEGIYNYELFNQYGRQERNSFVDIIESGPKRVWVRWTYLGVRINDPQPVYRGTEDFWAYPNGLILRRQTYQRMPTKKHGGYAVEPIELIVLCPVGKLWSDVLEKDPASEERHALAMLDAFSPKRYDVYWTPKPTPDKIWDSTHRQAGCTWKELSDSAGAALVIPLKEAAPFCVVGDAAGLQA